MLANLVMRRATDADRPALQAIREAAFAPVFASFRALLGDELYEGVQAREDRRQGELLDSLLRADSGWEVYTAELDERIVGFVSVNLDLEMGVGEIGLNAVDPEHAGRGVGTAMYEHTLARMTNAGMRFATVATGGDPSHAPARRAYQKAGFDHEIPSVWMCRRL